MIMRALKWPVPVDGDSHVIGGGKVLLVDSQDPSGAFVHVWTLEPDGVPADVITSRTVVVHGTGHHVVADRLDHIGSCMAGPFVWHVFAEVPL